MTERKFDIFELIDKIGKADIKYFDNLQDHEIKQIYPLVLMKWLGGTKNATQLKLINEIANSTVFPLYKHPKLMYKILMATTVSKGRVSWIKKKSKEKDTEILKIIKEYYECSTERAVSYLKLLSNEDIIDCAELLGTEKETMTKLKKELNG
jgi:hypothetical protein